MGKHKKRKLDADRTDLDDQDKASFLSTKKKKKKKSKSTSSSSGGCLFYGSSESMSLSQIHFTL